MRERIDDDATNHPQAVFGRNNTGRRPDELDRADTPAYQDRSTAAKVDGATAVADGKLVRPAGELLIVPGKRRMWFPHLMARLLLVKGGHGSQSSMPKHFRSPHRLPTRNGRIDARLAVKPAEGGFRLDGLFHVGRKDTARSACGCRWIGRVGPANSDARRTELGIALSDDGKSAYICMSERNALGIMDLASGHITKEIPVGVAPYDVVPSPDRNTALRHQLWRRASCQGAGHRKIRRH